MINRSRKDKKDVGQRFGSIHNLLENQEALEDQNILIINVKNEICMDEMFTKITIKCIWMHYC